MSAIIAGCSTPVRIHLFNNTDDEITVSYRAALGVRTDVIPPQESSEFESAWFNLRRGACLLKYQAEGIPPSEYVGVQNSSRHLTVQLEPDWRIFLLRVDEVAPIEAKGYAEPTGYPLTGEKQCGE
jgi:hypothetical protein